MAMTWYDVIDTNKRKTRSIWKMLGLFATASRRTPHCHSPGVATVARCLRIDVHHNDDDDDNDDNAWHRGPLWPHRMGPKINRQIQTTVKQLLVMVKSILYEGTIALGTGVDFGKGLGRSEPMEQSTWLRSVCLASDNISPKTKILFNSTIL